MLTLQQLKEEIEPEVIFASGTAIDKEDELFMANTGKELRWVAVRGGIEDWAIYCDFSYKNNEWIKQWGDKIHSEKHIRLLVPCDDEAFALYRH